MSTTSPANSFTTVPLNKRILSSRQQQQRHMTTIKDKEQETNEQQEQEDNANIYKPRNFGDIVREFIRNLAELSLKDYKWRSDIFKTMTADRFMEASLARMRGDDAPGYYRPMDASEKGPLGEAEDSAVTWLSRVIEEEGRRAQLILDTDGVLVRPMGMEERGPLADIEAAVVEFFDTIRDSEQLRKSLGVLRPKDLEESQRGPLGNAEFRLFQALKELSNAETLRYEQSQQRGSSVRPMDIPGPLGEVEAAVFEIFKAEQQRYQENADTDVVRPLRPMNAAVPGPLGEAEQEAIRAFQRLSEEERERLRGILKTLGDNRPMEINRNSILGVLEAVIVGVLRAPQMVTSTWDRVTELMKSEPLPTTTIESTKEKELQQPPQRPVTTTTLKMPPDTEDELGSFE